MIEDKWIVIVGLAATIGIGYILVEMVDSDCQDKFDRIIETTQRIPSEGYKNWYMRTCHAAAERRTR